MDPVKRPGAP
ncbi:hypothetical protein S40293_03979 [Stachybotrys chartarum IBT 40293]|nr:hypothetical protein S40293_03979 [Stachybotrys chartarum IBT 40293]